MFGFLKKKLTEFKEKILGSEKEVIEEPEATMEVKELEGETKVTKIREKPRKTEKKPGTKKREKKRKEKRLETAEKKGKEKKPGILEKIKKRVSGKFRLSEDELEEYLWDLELILLEADVAHEVAEEIIGKMRERLSEKEFSSRKEVFDEILSELRRFLLDLFPKGQDPLESSKRPTIVMFIGPNGAGKTTTMAKLAKRALDSGKTVIFAASDTFRAASIEQLEEHARKLGIRVIKHDYGADPAAVAFDAVKSAEARGIDFVFIDTAGRQETNRNLLEELKKIKRVVRPDFIIYVDEGIAGNVILERLREFGELGITGVILTKMDLDSKGGGAITAASLGIPIVYLGTGQGYDDLEPFDKEKFITELLG